MVLNSRLMKFQGRIVHKLELRDSQTPIYSEGTNEQQKDRVRTKD